MTYYIPIIPFPWYSLVIDKVNDVGVPTKVAINMGGKSLGFMVVYDNLEALKEEHPGADYMAIKGEE